MHRRRQVRLRYPQAMIDLTVLLTQRHGSHRAARALGLPLSTVYRWRDAAQRQPTAAAGDAAVADLIGVCSAHGFDLRQRVAALEPGVAAPPVRTVTARTHERGAGSDDVRRRSPLTHDSAERAADAACAPAAVRARLQPAREAIEQRYYAPLSCELLAALAGMSRFHFIRMFKSAFGVSPYRCLLRVRIRHARRLLSTTAQPLDTIAAAVGFDSPSLLSKAFKRIEGVTLASVFRGVRLGTRPPAVPEGALASGG